MDIETETSSQQTAEKEEICAETFIFLAAFVVLFVFFASQMGVMNAINTLMNTAYGAVLWPVSDGIYGRRGTRNQDIFQKLKHRSEMQPDKHDGSYELVRGIVSAYRDADESVLDYHDLNAVYLMCIGTWRHSYEKKRASIQDTHLSYEQKQKLNQLIDDLKGWAQAGLYSNQENGASGTGNIGMFGTGFCSFQDKTDVKSVRAVIKLCIDILDMLVFY